MVNVALPTLAEEFRADITTVQWVALIFFVIVSSLHLTTGRYGDMYGRRGAFAFGCLLFALASLACGLAPGLGWLIGARVVVAIGAALLQSNGTAILVAVFPSTQRSRALGLWVHAGSRRTGAWPAAGRNHDRVPGLALDVHRADPGGAALVRAGAGIGPADAGQRRAQFRLHLLDPAHGLDRAAGLFDQPRVRPRDHPRTAPGAAGIRADGGRIRLPDRDRTEPAAGPKPLQTARLFGRGVDRPDRLCMHGRDDAQRAVRPGTGHGGTGI